MASTFNPNFLEKLASGEIDLLTDEIRGYLVDTDTYTSTDFIADEFANELSGVMAGGTQTDDVGAYIVVGATKSVTGGLFDTTETEWDFLTPTDIAPTDLEAVVWVKRNTDADDSDLLAMIEGIDVAPNGADVTLTKNASGIFRIATITG